MMRSSIRINLVIAAFVALIVVGFAAAPVAAETQRFRSTEQYAFRLLNCLRTGGKVTAAGTCVGYGSGRFSVYRKPLDFSQKISNKIAFTYSSRIAAAGQCRHDLGSTTDQRFRTVGLRDDVNGENLACYWTSTPRHMVVYWTAAPTGTRSRTPTSAWPASAWRVIRAAAPPSSSTSTASASTDPAVALDQGRPISVRPASPRRGPLRPQPGPRAAAKAAYRDQAGAASSKTRSKSFWTSMTLGVMA
jgi:hypothetical protein